MDKGFRMSFRASAKGCLLQDVSFLICVEIRGSTTKILQVMDPLFPPELDQPHRQDLCLSGQVATRLVMYHPSAYPFGAIGQVECVWNCDQSPSLWMWIHPSVFQETWQALLESSKAEKVSDLEYQCDNGVKILSLKDKLCRFRLVGPLANQVLSGCLKVSEGPTEVEEYWQRLKHRSPGEAMNHQVIGMTVRDPRVLLPKKRATKIELEGEVLHLHFISFYNFLDLNHVGLATEVYPEAPSRIHHSKVWNESEREKVISTMLTTHEINQRRSKLLVPGSSLPLTEDESRIPILLIQQPGSDHRSFGAGWDLVTPSGWGMAFFMNLSYQGGIAAGLQTMNHLALEKGNFTTSCQCLDSSYGQVFMEETKQVKESVHFRYVGFACQASDDEYISNHFSYPPDKRVNYFKLGSPSPFAWPIMPLLRSYSEQKVDKCFILRSKSSLKRVEKYLTSHDMSNWPQVASAESALVPIQVTLRGKGVASDNHLIYLPSAEDQAQSEPVESPHHDVSQHERKELSKNHKKRKELLRRRWKSMKDKLVEAKGMAMLEGGPTLSPEAEAEIRSKIDKIKGEREKENSKYNIKLRQLWIPEVSQDQDFKSITSRQAIGFLCQGGFSFRIGKSVGLGYVPLLALKHLSGSQVLVKGRGQDQYRVAKLQVVHDVFV